MNSNICSMFFIVLNLIFCARYGESFPYEDCKIEFLKCISGEDLSINFYTEVTKCCERSTTNNFQNNVYDCIVNSIMTPCYESFSESCKKIVDEYYSQMSSEEFDISEEILTMIPPNKGTSCIDYPEKYQKYLLEQCKLTEKGKVKEYCQQANNS